MTGCEGRRGCKKLSELPGRGSTVNPQRQERLVNCNFTLFSSRGLDLEHVVSALELGHMSGVVRNTWGGTGR